MALDESKHVLLSYDWNSQDFVSEVADALKAANVPVWFEKQRDVKDNFYRSLTEGVENASVVCCFVTADYQRSEKCRLELQHAKHHLKRIVACLLNDVTASKPVAWLESVVAAKIAVDFQDRAEDKIQLKIKELIGRIREQVALPVPRIKQEPSHLFQLVKYEYKRNIHIGQPCINLVTLEPSEEQGRGRPFEESRNGSSFVKNFEEIYGAKASIGIKDTFVQCKNGPKQVLVFGGSGTGKSTFCRYAADRWASGTLWPQYKLVVLLRLAHLTEEHYPKLPADAAYTTFDLVHKEYLSSSYDLSDQDKNLLREQLSSTRILWLLDGNDEIGHNLSPHLTNLIDALKKDADHILTSRPYMNTNAHDAQVELTGFTDQNITDYVKTFFDQIQDKGESAALKSESLLKFLKSNPSAWHLARVPMHLELLCSTSDHIAWPETKKVTITVLYSKATEYGCRQYLTKQNTHDQNMDAKKVGQSCAKELAFLEVLAFNAMKSNSIILRPKMLEEAEQQATFSLHEKPHALDIGNLKTLDDRPVGAGKLYFFTHLSLQEYYAARYLITALNGAEDARQQAVEFIQCNKYDQRYELMFTFASGLIFENGSEACLDTFWHTLQGKPFDLVGLRHMRLTMACIAEAPAEAHIPQRAEMIEDMIKWMQHTLSTKYDRTRQLIHDCFRQHSSIIAEHAIQSRLIHLLQAEDVKTRIGALEFIADLSTSNLPTELIPPMVTAMSHDDIGVKIAACRALGRMDHGVPTGTVISTLVTAFDHKEEWIQLKACKALQRMGPKAATDEVLSKVAILLSSWPRRIRTAANAALDFMGAKANDDVLSKLLAALDNTQEDVRGKACEAIAVMDEKAVSDKVIQKLLRALEDENEEVRRYACDALGSLGEKVATNEVISKLITLIGDENTWVKDQACKALGQMGERATTDEVINALVKDIQKHRDWLGSQVGKAVGLLAQSVVTDAMLDHLLATLKHKKEDARLGACETLGFIGERVAVPKVINKLVLAMRDPELMVRIAACQTLGRLGPKAATDEVITKLLSALDDKSAGMKIYACRSLGLMASRSATSPVINKLLTSLESTHSNVRLEACRTLTLMYPKTATDKVIKKLVARLGDEDNEVRIAACKALLRLNAKVGTAEMIQALVTARRSSDIEINIAACETLGRMGSRAATDQVVNGLLTSVLCYNLSEVFAATEALHHILLPSAVVKELSAEIVEKLCTYMYDKGLNTVRTVPSGQYIDGYLRTKSALLLRVVTAGTLVEGSAVTMTENTIVVYSTDKTVSFDARGGVCSELVEAFIRQAQTFDLPTGKLCEAKALRDQTKRPASSAKSATTVSSACNLL